MMTLESSNIYELYLPATDMRKSFDSLCGLVEGELLSEPTNGTVYLFINKLRNKMKLLHWRTGGGVPNKYGTDLLSHFSVFMLS